MRRIVVAGAAGVLVLAGLAGLVLAFSARDDAPLSAGAPPGPGRLEPDRGARHGTRAPRIATSGPHRPELVAQDRRRLRPDAVIHALELGNVVLLYRAAEPPPPLVALQERVAGPFDAELAAAGQAVILARGGDAPVTALAWRRALEARDPADPALRAFAEAWLGAGLRP